MFWHRMTTAVVLAWSVFGPGCPGLAEETRVLVFRSAYDSTPWNIVLDDISPESARLFPGLPQFGEHPSSAPLKNPCGTLLIEPGGESKKATSSSSAPAGMVLEARGSALALDPNKKYSLRFVDDPKAVTPVFNRVFQINRKHVGAFMFHAFKEKASSRLILRCLGQCEYDADMKLYHIQKVHMALSQPDKEPCTLEDLSGQILEVNWH